MTTTTARERLPLCCCLSGRQRRGRSAAGRPPTPPCRCHGPLLACVEPRQRHPGGHALGVQLQRPRQRVLSRRRLHRQAGWSSWGEDSREQVRYRGRASVQAGVHAADAAGGSAAKAGSGSQCAGMRGTRRSASAGPTYLCRHRAKGGPQLGRGGLQPQAATHRPLRSRHQLPEARGGLARGHRRVGAQQLQQNSEARWGGRCGTGQEASISPWAARRCLAVNLSR